MKVIHQKAAGENIGRRQIHLRLRKIAEPQHGVLICAGRKFVDDVQLILSVKTVHEPRPAFVQWPGNSHAGCPVAQVEAPALFKTWKKIDASKSKMVIAHPVFERQNSSRGLSIRHRITAVLHGDRAQSLRRSANIKKTGDRIGDIKTVQFVVNLIGGGSVNVDLAARVLQHAGSNGSAYRMSRGTA